MRMLKSLVFLFSALVFVLILQAAAPDASSQTILKGAVAKSGSLDSSLIKGLPVYRRLVKVAGRDGQYRCTIEAEGYALKDVLERVGLKKVDDGFNRPLDTFITVKGREGQALLSYSEAFLAADGGPLLVDNARLVLPHHHNALNAGANDPTVLKSISERDRINFQSCASCHSGAKQQPLSLPKGWLLVVPQDGFAGRFVEGVTEIAVNQVGIRVKDSRESAGTAVVETPVLMGPDGKQTFLTAEHYQQFPHRTWSDATFGMGRGFHGQHTWQGADLGALLRPLLPAGTDPRKTWILVTAADGYRCLFSGSEVFSAPEGKGVMLADQRNGERFGPGSGRYNVVSRSDFYIDRSVKMVKEIRIGLVSTE